MTVTSLKALMPPPATPLESRGSWIKVSETLGTPLPSDFVEFIEIYGSGTISRFITVLNPFSERPTLNLAEQGKRQLEALRTLEGSNGERSRYSRFPARGGLLPVALTDNGDVIHWLTQGVPDDWTIVVNEARSPDYEHFNCDLSQFVVGLLTGLIEPNAFPRGVFSSDKSFCSI